CDGTPLHAYVIDDLINASITKNPTLIVEILDSGVSADERVYIIRSGVSRMARARPREAFDLIRGMNDAIARDEAARAALQLWAQHDAPAAAAAPAAVGARRRHVLGMGLRH